MPEEQHPDMLPRAVATLRAALEETDGNISHAAERLGIGRATLNRWLVGLPELAEFAADLRAASGHAAGRGAGAQREARGLGPAPTPKKK